MSQTAQSGAAVIATAAAFAEAGHAVLDASAQAPGPVDAVLLAGFGDPGLPQLRLAAAPAPVVGLAEACFLAAPARFAVLTLGHQAATLALPGQTRRRPASRRRIA